MRGFLLFLAIILFAGSAFALSLNETQKKVAVLDLLEESGLTVSDGSKAHKGSSFRAVLEEQQQKRQDIKTARDFIEKIATHTQEGFVYKVRFATGEEKELGKWFAAKLAEFEQ